MCLLMHSALYDSLIDNYVDGKCIVALLYVTTPTPENPPTTVTKPLPLSPPLFTVLPVPGQPAHGGGRGGEGRVSSP